VENKEGKFISLSGTELYYEIVGGGTPVLMLHGWGVDRRIMSGCMEFVFQKNKQKFMRIYFDLPGMGKSKAGESIKNSDGMLEVIIAFIEKVIPNQKFILVGESYGGYLARALVQKMSQRILGLFLICPLVYPGYRAGEVPAKTVLEKDVSLLESLTRQERESFEYITIVQNRRVWNGFKESAYEAI
jgi:pimeloyl-ACP methyl ester carboxylesterase